MRKYILPIVCFTCIVAAILLLVIPTPAEGGKVTAPLSVHYSAWNASYCRIDGTGDSFETIRSQCANTEAVNAGQLPVFRMDTAEELQAFVDLLEKNDAISLHMQDGGKSFAQLLPTYATAFFEENSLVLLYVCESSGSNRHQVNDVTLEGNAVTVEIGTILPESGDCDMAGWLIVLPFTKAQLPTDAAVIARRYGDADPVHTHTPAATPQLIDEPSIGGYCGNTSTTVRSLNGKAASFMYGPSVTITAMFNDLRYDQPLCECKAEYVVDTEFGLGYEVNLSAAFVRYEGKQAVLTAAQIDELRTAIEEGLKDPLSGK